MIFNKEETKNLITMLQSEDSENHIVAFEALKNVDFKKYTGEILVLYKFGCTDINKWIENCKTISNKLLKIVGDEKISNTKKILTGPRTLSKIINNNGSKASIELFMEYFVLNMTEMLNDIGYPVFEISVKLKNND